MEGVRAEYVKIREAYLKGETKKTRLPLEAARDNRFKIDWSGYAPPKPKLAGTRAFTSYKLDELVPYIDWTPFFQTWELSGKYPRIFEDNVVGAEAKKLFADAQALLKRIVAEKWLTANAVVGFWPANAVGDDIELFADGERRTRLAVLHTLRQQMARENRRDRANTALADFVAPKETGLADYVGAFAVTTGIGEAEALAAHIDKTDDYGRIMLKALADRLAEAFAERMHERVRRELWGYAPKEKLSQRGADRGEVSRHPAGAGLSGPARSHREGHHLPPARCRGEGRHQAHRELRHVAGRRRLRPLLLAPREPLLRRRQGRARPGRGLRTAQGLEHRGVRALAWPRCSTTIPGWRATRRNCEVASRSLQAECDTSRPAQSRRSRVPVCGPRVLARCHSR